MAAQQKILSTGLITLGDKAFNIPLSFDMTLTVTGSNASTASAPSKNEGGTYTFSSASWQPINGTGSLSTAGLYVLQNKGTASFMVAGTSTGGPISNPVLDPGDFIAIAYGPTSGVPALYVRSITNSASVAAWGGIEQ